MKIIVAPDSFKGSLTAPQAAAAMARGLARTLPQAEVVRLPLADGGEGTLEAVLAARGGERLSARVAGVDGRLLDVAWGLIDDAGEAAVLEAAQVVGLPLAGATPVAQRSSAGLGELLRGALDRGVGQFWIGLGGSSTNDGGAGLLAALGAGFFDRAGNPLAPTPAGLATLARADFSTLDARLAGCRLVALADVDNPLCGGRGATAVYGPQKGVAAAEVAGLDGVLARLGELGDAWRGAPLAGQAGSGAAGGLGWALRLLGAELHSGAEVICRLARLDEALARADWVITGEGCSDRQTLAGKVPAVVARHAGRAGVPVTLLSGALDGAALAELESDFAGCFSASTGPASLAECMANAASLLEDAAAQLGALLARCAEQHC